MPVNTQQLMKDYDTLRIEHSKLIANHDKLFESLSFLSREAGVTLRCNQSSALLDRAVYGAEKTLAECRAKVGS